MLSSTYDVLIIGTGGAGLSLALKLADHSVRIAVLSNLLLLQAAHFMPKVVFQRFLMQMTLLNPTLKIHWTLVLACVIPRLSD